MVFADFVVPDPAYTIPLLGGTILVAALLLSRPPSIGPETVFGFVPWIVAGALLHVLYQMHLVVGEDLLPAAIVQLLSAPAVYLTTFVAMGAVLLGSTRDENDAGTRSTATTLGLVGLLLASTVAGFAVWKAATADAFTITAGYPVLGLAGSLGLTGVLWVGLGRWKPDAIEAVGLVGALVIFAHVFDAVTTAIGVEFLDVGERSTLPRRVMEFAGDLPTAAYLGEAWLFVLLKVVVAVGIVVLFAEYVEEEPTEGSLFFAGIAAIGLGPAVHNFFLFGLAVGA